MGRNSAGSMNESELCAEATAEYSWAVSLGFAILPVLASKLSAGSERPGYLGPLTLANLGHGKLSCNDIFAPQRSLLIRAYKAY